MKTATRIVMALVMGIAMMSFTVSCATTSTQPETTMATPQTEGFLDGYYKDLQPGPKDGAKMRWLKPGVDFSKYHKIMLDSVIFYFANDSENKGIDAQEMKQLADSCNKALVDALQGSYPIVAEPGPDVVRLRFAITDIKQSDPALSAITSVIPVGIGISILKKGATGSWTGSGATSAELMALDSMTNDVIAVAQDKRSAGYTERFSKWGSAEEAFKYWGERIKLFMSNAQSMKQ
jgi:hypothetical protein